MNSRDTKKIALFFSYVGGELLSTVYISKSILPLNENMGEKI